MCSTVACWGAPPCLLSYQLEPLHLPKVRFSRRSYLHLRAAATPENRTHSALVAWKARRIHKRTLAASEATAAWVGRAWPNGALTTMASWGCFDHVGESLGKFFFRLATTSSFVVQWLRDSEALAKRSKKKRLVWLRHRIGGAVRARSMLASHLRQCAGPD